VVMHVIETVDADLRIGEVAALASPNWVVQRGRSSDSR
jgi:hypothetical protein